MPNESYKLRIVALSQVLPVVCIGLNGIVICEGRMAPPVEEAPTKVVKVATSVVRRRSATSTTDAVTKNTQSTTTTSSTTEGQTTNTPSATTTSTEGETPSSSAKDDDLHLKVLEESLLSAKTFSNYKGRYVDQSVNYPEQSVSHPCLHPQMLVIFQEHGLQPKEKLKHSGHIVLHHSRPCDRITKAVNVIVIQSEVVLS